MYSRVSLWVTRRAAPISKCLETSASISARGNSIDDIGSYSVRLNSMRYKKGAAPTVCFSVPNISPIFEPGEIATKSCNEPAHALVATGNHSGPSLSRPICPPDVNTFMKPRDSPICRPPGALISIASPPTCARPRDIEVPNCNSFRLGGFWPKDGCSSIIPIAVRSLDVTA